MELLGGVQHTTHFWCETQSGHDGAGSLTPDAEELDSGGRRPLGSAATHWALPEGLWKLSDKQTSLWFP